MSFVRRRKRFANDIPHVKNFETVLDRLCPTPNVLKICFYAKDLCLSDPLDLSKVCIFPVIPLNRANEVIKMESTGLILSN